MSTPASGPDRWREILRQQRLANAERWLNLVETSPNPSALVLAEYDNLLRTLEIVLSDPPSFDLAFRLIQAIAPIISGYADWERWLVYLQRLLETATRLGRLPEQARLLEQCGDIYQWLGKLPEAQDVFRQSAAYYQQLNYQANYAVVLAKKAFVYYLQGQTAESISLCQQALAIVEPTGDEFSIAHVNLNFSEICRRTQNWEQGLKAVETAHRLYEKLGKPEFVIKAVFNRAAYKVSLQQSEGLEEMAQWLIERLTTSKDIRTLSQLKINLGVFAFQQGNYKTAEKLWSESLQLHTQVQDPTELALIYNNLGMVYTRMSEWDAAYDMLQEAVTRYQNLGEVNEWANSMDNLADLYEAQQKTAEFRHTLQQAIKGLEQAGHTPANNPLLAAMLTRLANSPPPEKS